MDGWLYKDRIDAAKKMATKLTWIKDQFKEDEGTGSKNKNVIVLAIPRGGVVVGDIIASMFNLKLDIVVSRKVGAPDNPELAIGAVMPDGTFYPNSHIINYLSIPQNYIDSQVQLQVKEIERRLVRFRGSKDYNIKYIIEKTVVLVDDGIATGATMIAAASWLKTVQNCKNLVIAVPVAPSTNNTMRILSDIADRLIILDKPETFNAVGQFYQHFSQIEDQEVFEIMKRYGYNLPL